jgi:hypothetical protein
MDASVREAIEQAALAVADDLEDVERIETGDVLELRRGGVEFARFDTRGAGFRVGRPVVTAAIRTPGAEASDLGADWVGFRPETADRFALDRAIAWVEVAWRRAEPSTEGRPPG